MMGWIWDKGSERARQENMEERDAQERDESSAAEREYMRHRQKAQTATCRVAHQCAVAKKDHIGRPEGKWICRRDTLVMTTLYGARAPTIEVQEGCVVTGKFGHATIYERRNIQQSDVEGEYDG